MIARRDEQGVFLPTIHPNLLCSLWENGRRGLDSCHPMWPVIALKVHTVVRDGGKNPVLCCGCPQRDHVKEDDATLLCT